MSKAIGHNWVVPAAPVQAIPLPQVETNPLQKVAFGLVAFYTFLLYSRLQDFVYFLHLPAITLSLALIAIIASGSAAAVMKVPCTRWIIALTVCMIFGVPFSVWPGGAVDTILNAWIKTLLGYILVTSVVVVPQYCTRLISFAAFGVLCGSLMGFVAGSDTLGRMGEASARFGDANEFAQVLLTGMSLMLGYLATRRNRFSRIVAYAAVLIMLVSFFRTGSRGGLIGLMAIGVYFFFKGSAGTKVGILALTGIIVVCVTYLLPDAVRSRYALLLGSRPQNLSSTELVAAAGSAEGREHLLTQSLIITVQHPLFGVGTGMFAVAENNVAKAQGMSRGLWHETHNMYTQVSSENGIPAGIFFITMLVVASKTLSRIVASGKDSVDPVIIDASRTAYWLRIALLGSLASGFFLSTAYTVELLVLVGFGMGLHRSLDLYLQQTPASPVMAAPMAPPLAGHFNAARFPAPQRPFRPPVRPAPTSVPGKRNAT
jgi:hypothetical protein